MRLSHNEWNEHAAQREARAEADSSELAEK